MRSKPEQYTRADLTDMSPAEINAAHAAGNLRDLLTLGDKDNPYRPYGANKSRVGEPVNNRDYEQGR